MEISDLTVRILFLFLPGIICSVIVDIFTVHRPKDVFHYLLESFIYGVLSYFIYWLWLKLPFTENKPMNFMYALFDNNKVIVYKEIFCGCIAAVLLGISITYISTYKLHTRLAHRIKMTKKFGELDVWGYTFNSKNIEYVTVRDHKNNLVYDGWVQSFSDDSKNAELLLRDVSIYKNDTAEQLYQIGAIYLSLNKEDIAIEFRDIEIDKEKICRNDKNE